jgi:hypothetical protein
MLDDAQSLPVWPAPGQEEPVHIRIGHLVFDHEKLVVGSGFLLERCGAPKPNHRHAISGGHVVGSVGAGVDGGARTGAQEAFAHGLWRREMRVYYHVSTMT